MKSFILIIIIALFVYSLCFSGCSKIIKNIPGNDKICLDKDSAEKILKFQNQMNENSGLIQTDSLRILYDVLKQAVIIDTNEFIILSKEIVKRDNLNENIMKIKNLDSQLVYYKSKSVELETEIAKYR